MSLPSLPTPLLLLIHLHLLNFPSKGTAEYDEHLFDPRRRGIRDRTSTMEDITYFLVGKLEGSTAAAKKILPMYPCVQPSDTVAFRTSLTKYTESLKNSALRAKESTPNGPCGTQDHAAAHWWKEVAIRKSLLEECSGERFERLLLSLSTHAVFKCALATPGSGILPFSSTSPDSLSQVYLQALQRVQLSRIAWEHSITRLVKRSEDLKLLRSCLANPHTSRRSRYQHIATNKLLELQKSRESDLLSAFWTGDTSTRALEDLVDLAGLTLSFKDPLIVNGPISDSLSEGDRNIQGSAALAQPLPVSAAHHPSQLASLRNVALASSIRLIDEAEDHTQGEEREQGASSSILIRYTTNSDIQQRLQNALSQSRIVGERLRAQLELLKGLPTTSTPKAVPVLRLPGNATHCMVNFRHPPSKLDIQHFGLEPLLDHELTLHQRISEIRRSLLPGWPPVPSPPEPPAPPSKLSKPTATAKSLLKNPQYIRVHLDEPVKFSRVAPRKSNVLMKGRARRSSIFARRKTLNFDEEVDRIVGAVLEGYVPDEAHDDIIKTPEGKATQGAPLTPLSIIKGSLPRPSFDMDSRVRALAIPLPRLSQAHALLNQSVDEADESDHGAEGNSMTLREILLRGDLSIELVKEGDIGEDSDGGWN